MQALWHSPSWAFSPFGQGAPIVKGSNTHEGLCYNRGWADLVGVSRCARWREPAEIPLDQPAALIATTTAHAMNQAVRTDTPVRLSAHFPQRDLLLIPCRTAVQA